MTIKEIFKKFKEYSELNVEDLKNLLVNRINLLPINPLDSKKALVQNILKHPKILLIQRVVLKKLCNNRYNGKSCISAYE